MAIDLTKFIVRFIEEAREHLRRLSEGLCELEQHTANADAINALFRSAHTIKGSSRMLKLMPITNLSHQLEDVLGLLRDGSCTFDAELGQVLHRAVDALSLMVDQLYQQKNPSHILLPDDGLVVQLQALLRVEGADSLVSKSIERVADTAEAIAPLSSQPNVREEAAAALPMSAAEAAPTQLKTADTVRIRLTKLDELLGLMGEMVSSHSRLRQRLHEAQQLSYVGRLSTTEQQALQSFRQALKEDVQHQELQMNELLDKALLMRMLPLSIVFEPASRLVRELGQSIGKSLSCVVNGSEIELDRQLIDRLSDPIIHLIRNAIDHGIESPEQRVANGKSEVGKITLSARQDAGWVVIEVADDGAGIPLTDVLEKAIRKELITRDKATNLSEQEIIDFIFLPGFSTSQIITDLSGRGVGMDVVKSIIVDDLHGSISVETTPKKGTVFQLRLPMSLAVMRVLIVSSGNQQWGFTAQYASELLTVATKDLLTVAERQVIILRNEFVPVVALSDLLGLSCPEATRANESLLLLVVRIRHEKLALIIDHIEDERDLVIKPLPPHLRFNQRVSGMVVAGNNHLVNVLHAPTLLTLARKNRHKSSTSEANVAVHPLAVVAKHILVVDDSLNTREIEKDVLEAHGYQVTLAEDGVDGLHKAREMDFDAILTDVEMPNMDGFTFTAQLRQEERYRHKPIMIITSREKEEDKRRGMQVGADAYIVKGDFDQSNLVATLQALLA